MAEELKPCPFCGGEAILSENSCPDYGYWFWAWCKKCEAQSQEYHHEFEAIKAWNNRV